MPFPVGAHTETHGETVLARLGAELRFDVDQVLGETGSPIKSVFLVLAGLVSVVVPLVDGHAVEAAMAGRGMLLGGPYAFGCRIWKNTAVGQLNLSRGKYLLASSRLLFRCIQICGTSRSTPSSGS